MRTVHSQPLTVPVLWNVNQVYLEMRYKYIKFEQEGGKKTQTLMVLLENVTEVKNQHLFGHKTYK